MFKVFQNFFDFCGRKNKNKFYKALILALSLALVEAFRVPAIYVMVDAVLKNQVTNQTILICLGIMLVSVIIASILRYSITMLQCEGGYYTCAEKRIEIAEHMRYLPMGYFNRNSLGTITSVTTNKMEQLGNIATRVVMMTTQGILQSVVITGMICLFDIRIGLMAIVGVALFFGVNGFLQKASAKLAPMKNASDTMLVEQIIEYGIDMVFSKGSFTSVVGESGCGKSTVSAILMGRNKGYTGSVTIGGIELSELSEENLLANLTYISHQSYLFKGTVRDNLLMGCPSVDDEKLWQVLDRVNLSNFLRSEAGLDTRLNERASNLSGGQCQRLALARALLHDSPVYIFDEATSNIDVESENDIMREIHALAKTKTVILISHRLANVTASDNIYVMDKGYVVESGSHEELLTAGKTYARLWNSQAELENYGKAGA